MLLRTARAASHRLASIDASVLPEPPCPSTGPAAAFHRPGPPKAGGHSLPQVPVVRRRRRRGCARRGSVRPRTLASWVPSRFLPDTLMHTLFLCVARSSVMGAKLFQEEKQERNGEGTSHSSGFRCVKAKIEK